MSGIGRQRLDERMLADGLTETRSRAQSLIRAGRVLVDDTPVDKPGTAIRSDARVRVRGEDRRFVSRGGEKLAGALADLGVDPAGRICLDIGASTGGFTDCLLQSGARHVFAVDVGYGQLDVRLRDDPRVTVMERTNARHLDAAALDPRPDLVAIDVSFISVCLLLPTLAEQLPAAELLIMVKPQFEVGREQVGKGGVVRDPGLRAAAVAKVKQCAEELSWTAAGDAESCLAGPKGNREIFVRFAPRSVDT
ncbi:MAG: TlyA family RNA methyltransferase [Myxococcales bacterium]|jgi:23S rRNA (cytidine1920-2'-O)/16S rRNA (cytidine1409-2'-O)-methyltransferase|nr:TlyA family RNA methyltransferase [Myxococcales bacterium]